MSRLITNKSIENLTSAMNWAANRQKILQHNLANADTPNYQRRDLDFAQELAGEVDRLPLKRTHARHLGASMVEPNNSVTQWGVVRVDQNGVDPEVEMVTTVQNFMYFQGLTQELNSQFRRLRMAIQGR